MKYLFIIICTVLLVSCQKKEKEQKENVFSDRIKKVIDEYKYEADKNRALNVLSEYGDSIYNRKIQKSEDQIHSEIIDAIGYIDKAFELENGSIHSGKFQRRLDRIKHKLLGYTELSFLKEIITHVIDSTNAFYDRSFPRHKYDEVLIKAEFDIMSIYSKFSSILIVNDHFNRNMIKSFLFEDKLFVYFYTTHEYSANVFKHHYTEISVISKNDTIDYFRNIQIIDKFLGLDSVPDLEEMYVSGLFYLTREEKYVNFYPFKSKVFKFN